MTDEVACSRASGIFPDSVISDPEASGYLLFLTLRPDLSADELQTWLQGLTTLIGQLEAASGDGDEAEPGATCAVGFGPSFFATEGGPRFGLPTGPADFAQLPALPAVADLAGAAADLAIYIMATREALVASFLRGLTALGAGTITTAMVERGYQRTDGREQFGFRDGLRNVASDRRDSVIFIDRDNQPEEPSWAQGGTYMAYMKVHQDLEAAAALGQESMEQIIGRRIDDGSRLDLPVATDPHTEGEFADPNNPPPASHIRKAGPRDDIHDRSEIFRRGVPYTELRADGTLDAGLQFVSFQCSLANFNVILNRWMLNPDFPGQGTGQDALFARGLVSVEKAAFYFIPPADDRFLGAGFFDPPAPDPCLVGKLIIQKQVVDQNGQPVVVDLGGFQFQIVDGNGQVVGAPNQTDSAGHAISPELERGQTYTLQEINVPAGFQAPDIPAIQVNAHRQTVSVLNQVQGAAPPYNP